MNSKEKLLKDIREDLRVKRLHELESYIDSNDEIKSLLDLKKNISKQMVLSKHIGLINNYNEYKARYDLVNEKISNYPFVMEYLDILEDLNNDLKIMVNYIEKKINNDLK